MFASHDNASEVESNDPPIGTHSSTTGSAKYVLHHILLYCFFCALNIPPDDFVLI
jgi:hypothetical protein